MFDSTVTTFCRRATPGLRRASHHSAKDQTSSSVASVAGRRRPPSSVSRTRPRTQRISVQGDRPGGGEDVLARVVGQGHRLAGATGARRAAGRRRCRSGRPSPPATSTSPDGARAAPRRGRTRGTVPGDGRRRATPGRTRQRPDRGSATSLCRMPVPAESTCARPASTTCARTRRVGVHERPLEHPGDDLQLGVRVLGVARSVAGWVERRRRCGTRAGRSRGWRGRSAGPKEKEWRGQAALDRLGRPRPNRRTEPPSCRYLRGCDDDPPRAHFPVAPSRLPLRHEHGELPDRGRGDRGRQGPEHLGHLQPPSRAASPTAAPATSRATTTTGSTRTSR